MARVLKISKEISLPLDAATQTIAVIGRKGSGKTYLGTMIAEQFLDEKIQTIILDPVGVWWGLRVAADGKTKGKQIFVIGGDHGDVPIVPEAGARIAKLIIEKGISAVIDVSGFRVGELKRFAGEFAEEFFQLKKAKRSAAMLFAEEAQLFMPQNIRPDEGRMYSAFERIVRLGRNYGIGCTLITQRPQSVNKEVLSQVECLCVLQITGPHERKALEYWVQEAGADRKLIGELPGLERGEGYVWSPAWLKIYKRVHFSKKQTFDASATPEVGKKTRAASLSAVDVAALKSDMADVVAQAEKDDPVALRRRIAELERTPKQVPVVDPEAISRAVAAREKELVDFYEKREAIYKDRLEKAGQYFKAIEELMKLPPGTKISPLKAIPIVMPKPAPVSPEKPKSEQVKVEVSTNEQIDGPQQKVLNAIAWMNSIGVPEPEKPAVAFVAGYSPSSSGFQNACGALRSKGLVIYPGGKIALTDAGRSIAEIPAGPLSNEELQRKILDKLPGPERAILTKLVELHPQCEYISKDELAQMIEKSPSSSGYQNACGRLRSLGLVEYPASGQIRAAGILFPL